MMAAVSPGENEDSKRKTTQVSHRRLPKRPKPNEDEGRQQWCDMYTLLKCYQQEKSHISPRVEEDFHGQPLGRWVADQKFYFEQLSMIGFVCSGSVTSTAKSNVNHGEKECDGTLREKSPCDDVPSKVAFADPNVKWNIMYQLLKEYQAEHDHLNLAQAEVYKGKTLGCWVQAQRQNFRLRQQGKLGASSIKMSDDRLALLNVIGFLWDGKMTAQESNDLKWNSMYQLLKQYCGERGHVSPFKEEMYKDQKLGLWAASQRRRYNQQQSGRLDVSAVTISDQQIELLNDIDFIWDSEKAEQASTPRGTQWNSMYHLLQDYNAEYKHAFPVPGELYQGQILGDWVDAQRGTYLLWQNGQLDASLMRLTELQIALLNESCFVWEKREEIQVSTTGHEACRWHYMYRLLKDYAIEFKHVCPLRTEKYRDQNLGKWVHSQRSYNNRKRGESSASSTTFPDEREALLNEIGFIWELRGQGDASIRGGSKWESMYQLLKDYQAEYNHVSPPDGEIYMGRNLGYWVGHQRKAYALRLEGKLGSSSLRMSDQRLALLNELGFVWGEKKRGPVAWETMYKLLKDFGTVHNHVCPSKRVAYKGHNLGLWVYSQRQFYRKRQEGLLHPSSIRMTDERIDLLNCIGFVWNMIGQNKSQLMKNDTQGKLQIRQVSIDEE
mmetsp:Transcript_17532/g.22742  ORF Transcript_17532/g.22742 Transcript_17532/m.22742 type:complete len:665 (-) Transcript_17532:6-2000(-)